MHYGEIKNCDIANGLGVRVTLFVSGCTNHCENCFQPQTWDFCYGKPFTSETEDELIRLLPTISTVSRCSAASRSSPKISARCCRFSAA
jgi:organic radical activating enzyme